jgi:hypothetical protein
LESNFGFYRKNLKLQPSKKMSMSQAINPYRYGVLEGNHAEDRFGLDLAAKQVTNPSRNKI